MADHMKYNYDAMDTAYEEMMRINRDVEGELQRLKQEAHRVLSVCDGKFVNDYDTKARELKDLLDNSNRDMAKRAIYLQQKFNEMGETDVKLGNAISGG